MSPTTRSRRRFPARVYWVRRGAVLITALALVFAFARLLGSSGGGAGDQAEQTAGTVGSTTSATPTTRAPSGPIGPVGVTTTRPNGQPTGAGPRLPLAVPDGPCDDNEITVTPVIATATAGGVVKIDMQLTGIEPACTFEVSSETLAVRITRKDQRVWTSQQCPFSIHTRSLVVRSATPIPIVVRWSGRRSDIGCTKSAGWALPGNYTVTAAVIGSEPTDKRFALLSPPRPIVTRTITPKPKPTPIATKTPTATPTGKVD